MTAARVAQHRAVGREADWKHALDGYRVECACGFVSHAYRKRETAEVIRCEHVCQGKGRRRTSPRRSAKPRPHVGTIKPGE